MVESGIAGCFMALPILRESPCVVRVRVRVKLLSDS